MCGIFEVLGTSWGQTLRKLHFRWNSWRIFANSVKMRSRCGPNTKAESLILSLNPVNLVNPVQLVETLGAMLRGAPSVTSKP